jgi:hypothetical protein
MRRQPGRTVTVWLVITATVLSLTCCIGAVVLWIRSFTRFDDVCRAEPMRCINVVSLHGELYVQVAAATAPLWERGWTWDALRAASVRYSPGNLTWQFLGFAKGYNTTRNPKASVAEHVFVLPHWFVSLAFTLPAALCVRAMLRERLLRQRAVQGLCLQCGYNLTGNVSGICPECGGQIQS